MGGGGGGGGGAGAPLGGGGGPSTGGGGGGGIAESPIRGISGIFAVSTTLGRSGMLRPGINDGAIDGPRSALKKNINKIRKDSSTPSTIKVAILVCFKLVHKFWVSKG